MKPKKSSSSSHRKYYDIYECGEFKRRAKNDEDALMGWVDASTKNLYAHTMFVEECKNPKEIDAKIITSQILSPVLVPFYMIADGFHYTNSDGNNEKMFAYADAWELYFEASGLSDELAGWKGAIYQLFRSIISTDINRGILCGEIGYFKMMYARATANDVFLLFKKPITESVEELEKQKRITVREAQLHEVIKQYKDLKKSGPLVMPNIARIIDDVLNKNTITFEGIVVDTSDKKEGHTDGSLRAEFDRKYDRKKRKYKKRA